MQPKERRTFLPGRLAASILRVIAAVSIGAAVVSAGCVAGYNGGDASDAGFAARDGAQGRCERDGGVSAPVDRQRLLRAEVRRRARRRRADVMRATASPRRR